MEPVRWLRTLAGVSQEELARRGSTSQPTVAAYEAGRKSPTLRTVQRLAAGCGLEAFVDFAPPLTREDRRSIHLHRAIAARLLEDPATVISQAQRNLRRMRAVQPDAAPLFDEWRRILRRPVADMVAAMTDPRPWARELRQVTPFAGVLSARERAVTYGRFHRQELA